MKASTEITPISQEPARAPSPRFSRRGILLTAAIVFLGAVLAGFGFRRMDLYGDSWEYSWITYSIAEHGSPVIDIRQKEVFARKYPDPQNLNENFLIPLSRGRYDTPHFWMYSLLASPFYILCDVLGHLFKHPHFFLHAFLLLHATLLGLTAAVAYTFWGRKGAGIFALFFVASPVLFYLTKPHTELFTFCCFTLSLLLTAKERYLIAACCLAMAATQNTPLIPFVLLLIGMYLWKNGVPRRLGEFGLLIACLVIAFMDPAFYWIRHHAIDGHVVVGAAGISLISFRKALSLFIDPDLGLFANWPLGLLLVAMAIVVHRHIRKIIAQHLPAALFSAIFILVMPFFQSIADNWNNGGTPTMSRYATWYLPIFLVWLVLATAVPAGRYAGATIRASLIVLGFLALPCIALNVKNYAPSRPERYLRRTAIAKAIYRRWPGLYDPVPEVFFERAAGTDGPLNWSGNWAAANATCNKIYIALIPPQWPNLPKPAGCTEPVDSAQLVRWLRQKHFMADANGYVNLPERVAKHFPPPVYTLGTTLDFAKLSADRYLGRGWSIQEPAGRWSDGSTAEIAFRLASLPARRTTSLLRVTGGPYLSGTRACRTAVAMNGVLVGNLDAAHQSAPETYELSLPLSHVGEYRLTFQFNGVRQPPRNDPDPRRLCFYLRSMEISTALAVEMRNSLPVYHGGDVIDFADSANEPFLTSGWSWQEQAGRWSDGSPAIITFYFDPRPNKSRDYALVIRGGPILRNGRAPDLQIFVNGRPVGKLDARHESAVETYALRVGNLKAGKCEVKFVIDHGHPAPYGADPRRLGFYIRSLEIASDVRTRP